MPPKKPLRAALYLRVSTTGKGQTTENQRQALEAAAESRGWTIVQVFEDAGISGAKGRDKRPEFDAMLKAASRRGFDVLMAWHIDRLGRSLMDLLHMLQDLDHHRVSLYVDQQNMDTTTPGGRALFQIAGVFAEFERSMIQARIHAGLDRARKNGVRLGKAALGTERDATKRHQSLRRIAKAEELLKDGISASGVVKQTGLGAGTVIKIRDGLIALGKVPPMPERKPTYRVTA